MTFSKRIVRFCVGWLAAACLLCTAAAAAPLDRWRDCGVLTVSCGLSAPDAPLNRGEMAVLLSQLLGLTGDEYMKHQQAVNSWLLYDSGETDVSPETYGVARP